MKAILLQIVAIVVIGVVLIFLGKLVIDKFFDKGVDIIESTGDAVVDVIEALPSLISREYILDEFTAHIDKMEGMTYLQVGKVESTEAFVVTDKAYILDLNLLPDVNVMYQGPVEFTYYVDLKEQWDFIWNDETYELIVVAPRIHYNTPAINVSQLVMTVDGSVFRNENQAEEKLRKAITPISIRKAQAKESYIRETARNSIEEFVNDWFINLRFHDSERTPHLKTVYFANEILPQEVVTLRSEL